MADLSARHQRYADAILAGKTQSEAYIDAGYSAATAHKNCSRLMANEGIQAYIAAQRAQAAQNASISVEWVLESLMADRAQAIALGQPSAATAATVHIGKHLGMWPTKIAITNEDRDAATAAAEKLGIDPAEVLAEVERELKESR